jgi:hypothetical protein
MKRIISTLLASIGLFGATSCGAQINIGHAKILVPAGWREINKDKERITLASLDDRQQVTISLWTFDHNPTFDDFKHVCEARLKAERTEAPDAQIQADEPFKNGETFGMFFSGKEVKAGRLFSGFVTQKDAEVITIYLESIGADSKVHFQSFETFVKGLKR